MSRGCTSHTLPGTHPQTRVDLDCSSKGMCHPTVLSFLPRVLSFLSQVLSLLPLVFPLLPWVFPFWSRVFSLLPPVFSLLPPVFPFWSRVISFWSPSSSSDGPLSQHDAEIVWLASAGASQPRSPEVRMDGASFWGLVHDATCWRQLFGVLPLCRCGIVFFFRACFTCSFCFTLV